MNKHCRISPVAVLLLALECLAASASAQTTADSPVSAIIDVSHAALALSPVAMNWPSYNGDYTGRRYTRLDQITAANGKQYVAIAARSDVFSFALP